MTILINSYILSHETKGFGINSDILETNLINIIILIALLVYVLGNFLQENLSSRQDQIINSIQESEKRLNEANERLAEAKAQWVQGQILFEKIKKQAKQSRDRLILAAIHQANEDLSYRFNSIFMFLSCYEEKVLDDLTKEFSKLALSDVKLKIQAKLEKTDQSLLIDKQINRLGGQI